MDRTPDLHPDDREAYEIESLWLRAAGIDDALAEMSPEVARYGAAQIIAQRGDTPEGRAAAVAWLDLWRERHRHD